MSTFIGNKPGEEIPEGKMGTFRMRIDQIDHQLITLLGQRIAISILVGHHKAENNMQVRDEMRETEILKALEGLGADREVPAELIREIYEKIIAHSRAVQEEIILAMRGTEKSADE